MRFKSWNDFKRFMDEYAVCSCFNCIGFHEDEEFNGRFICWKTLSPVRMDMIKVCTEWENYDGKVLKDFEDKNRFKISDEILNRLDNIEDMVSFEEIREIVENNECE